MLLRVSHETRLNYSEPVSETIFEVRKAPQSDEDQTVLGYRLRTAPKGSVTSYRDGFGNRVELFNVAEPYQELQVVANSYVRTHRRWGEARLSSVPWPGEQPPAIDALEFLQPSPLISPGQALNAFVETLPEPSGSLADVAQRLWEAVSGRLEFEKKVTSAKSPVSEALDHGRGVCQDFAHLYIGACRAIGLPARYVSGYVCQPGELATHAWCQIWAGENIGWADIDPTHRVFAGDGHIVTAVGRDYSDVPPNRGLWRGKSEESITVNVKVEPIDRMPPQWQEFQTPGKRFASASSSRRNPAASRPDRPWLRDSYPFQPDVPGALRQQQGQQQQQQQ